MEGGREIEGERGREREREGERGREREREGERGRERENIAFFGMFANNGDGIYL